MHYMICYDIENDRLRTKAAAVLARHGCARVQRSVFVAANLDKKNLARLQADLKRLLDGRHAPGDSLLIVPLRDEHVAEIHHIGDNTIFTELEKFPLKILL